MNAQSAETVNANTLVTHQHALDVLKKFRIIYGTVRQHFREVEQGCGISGSQLWMLQEVSKSPDIGVSELARRMSVHQSTCSQLIEKLVGKKLVKKVRSTEDQRRVGLFVTEAADAVMAKAPGPAEGILPEVLMALPMPVLQEIDASLAKIINQLRNRDYDLAEEPLSEM
jgi:MarR family transcriptional regulator, organic hydroperoxide resistance regulator